MIITKQTDMYEANVLREIVQMLQGKYEQLAKDNEALKHEIILLKEQIEYLRSKV